jgi:hypothetical protein
MGGAIRRALAVLRADQLGDLDLHQLLDYPPQRLRREVRVLVAHQLGDDLIGRHPLPLGHRGAPFVELHTSDDPERRAGRNYLVLSAAVLHHALGRDRFSFGRIGGDRPWSARE